MMRLFLLVTVTMIAFAANSVLNRWALSMGGIDAMTFGTLRLLSGAVVLVLLTLALRGRLPLGGPGRWISVAALLLYIYGFSSAYQSLDAGLGALILFGCVQVTMFAGGLIAGERPTWRRWVGAGLAFAGLVALLAPTNGGMISALHGALMALAGVGWGIYSLAGKKAVDALAATAANFLFAALLGALFVAVMPVGPTMVPLTGAGIGLAVLSGAVTSGLGYALWYSVLPQLDSSAAAVAQLTVPVLAVLGGMVFLGEELTLQFAITAAVILGGVGFSVWRPRSAS